MTSQPISIPQSASDTGEEVRAEPRAKTAPATPAKTTPPHAAGMLWCGGWLFTIGFAKLIWWKALLALVLWPYFLGESIR